MIAANKNSIDFFPINWRRLRGVGLLSLCCGLMVGCAQTSQLVETSKKPLSDAKFLDQMSGRDQQLSQQTVQRGLESALSGEQLSWSNSLSGNSGTIQIVRTYQREDGRYCRVFEEKISIKTETRNYQAILCRFGPSDWR